MNIRAITRAKTLSLLSALAFTAAPALAGFSQGNEVTMDGSAIFRIDCAADGFSAEHRAWLSQDALDNALVLSNDKSATAVNVEKRNGAFIVALGGRKVATADSGSSKAEGLSPQQLATKWADSIRSFLGDDAKTQHYMAMLKDPNALQADVAIVERRLYAPAGTMLPVAFTTTIDSENCRAGETIEAKITEDVPLGSYVIPSGSLVLGSLVETQPGCFGVTFNTLRTPNGTDVAISANATESYVVRSAGPHAVCTLGIPADPYASMRLPATLGIGAVGGAGSSSLALYRGTSRVIALGQPFTVVLDAVTPVAVVNRSTAM